MQKFSFISPGNPVRAWSRRLVRGTRNRPDVQLLQLQRRIGLLEDFVDLKAHSRGWIDTLIACLMPLQFAEMPLVRMGSQHDGGYVLPAALSQMVSGVVSIGVGDNNTVDLQLAAAGLRVHAWDHTVAGLPSRHENIVFHQVGLGDSMSNPALRSLAEICDDSFGRGSGHLLLLLDAEGAEWTEIAAASEDTLARFDVIGIEMHDLGDLILDPSRQLPSLTKLHRMFVPVAVHANNHACVWRLPGLDLPDAIEVTYVNRALLTSSGVTANCPVDLTSPCCPDLPEVPISWVPA